MDEVRCLPVHLVFAMLLIYFSYFLFDPCNSAVALLGIDIAIPSRITSPQTRPQLHLSRLCSQLADITTRRHPASRTTSASTSPAANDEKVCMMAGVPVDWR